MDAKIEKKLPKLIKNAQILIKAFKPDIYGIQDTKRLKQLGVDAFGFYSLPFLFTTENINGYMDNLDLEGKDILTVVGSGDQILNSVLKGAKKVDAFDISGYALLFYYLKEAAVKSLSYEEFVSYFLNSESRFDLNLYQKLRPNLNRVALTFWDELYKEFGHEPRMMRVLFRQIRADIIGDDFALAGRLGAVASYWNPNEYYELRQRLSNAEINCFVRDVNKLDDIGVSYDYVFLSNILNYQQENIEQFRASISRYISMLNNGGEIKIGYFYGESLAEETFNLTCQSLALDGIEISCLPSYYFSMFTPQYIPNTDRMIEYKKR